MDRKELRIGNYLHFVVMDNICKVVGIGSEQAADGLIETCDLNGNYNAERPIEDFCPIDITPEWIDRFKFKDISGWGIVIDLSGESDQKIGVSYCRKWLRNIEYVHQLQNLYYALTSTDLETA